MIRRLTSTMVDSTVDGKDKSKYKFSEEHRKKLSEAKKGKKRTEETKRKISLARKDRKHSEETKMKIGFAQKGEKHHHYGKHYSKESLKKMSESLKGKYVGENSFNWKGDDVGYKGLHIHVRKLYPPPEKCQMCMKVPPYDLANVTGIYNREFKNWRYYCRKCHIITDNRFSR